MDRLMRCESYLIKKGYNNSFKGFEYLLYILNNYKNIRTCNITSIYDEIASKYDTTYTRVERNIRYLISLKNDDSCKKVISDLIYDFNKKKGE